MKMTGFSRPFRLGVRMVVRVFSFEKLQGLLSEHVQTILAAKRKATAVSGPLLLKFLQERVASTIEVYGFRLSSQQP